MLMELTCSVQSIGDGYQRQEAPTTENKTVVIRAQLIREFEERSCVSWVGGVEESGSSTRRHVFHRSQGIVKSDLMKHPEKCGQVFLVKPIDHQQARNVNSLRATD